MPQLAPRLTFTFDDDLEWEKRQPIRHEFIRGEIFAMADTTDLHNEICLNLGVMLRQHLRGTPCRVFMADVKARVETADCGFYQWLMDSVGPGECLRLESFNWECPVEKVYEDLSEPPAVGAVEPERRLV